MHCCVSTATVVRPTRNSVTLYVDYPYCHFKIANFCVYLCLRVCYICTEDIWTYGWNAQQFGRVGYTPCSVHSVVKRRNQLVTQSTVIVPLQQEPKCTFIRAVRDTSIFIHSAVCLMTGPMPPPKRFLHIVRFKASSFRWEYPLPSLRSSSNFLRLLPLLLVTSISPFILPSITCRIRQFLRSMWPIQLAFRFRISRRIFLCSLTRK